mgnify:CR=1 FL=1
MKLIDKGNPSAYYAELAPTPDEAAELVNRRSRRSRLRIHPATAERLGRPRRSATDRQRDDPLQL